MTTVLLCVIWMCSTFGYFGIVLLTTEILDLFDVLHAENKSDGTLWPCGVGKIFGEGPMRRAHAMAISRCGGFSKRHFRRSMRNADNE